MEVGKLVRELIQGKELANQLKTHLKDSSSQETNRLLIAQILSSYEKAISILHNRDSSVGDTKPSVNQSPKSEISDVDSKNVFRKRKTSEKAKKVKVCVGPGHETPGDDGYCWRKYGQKEILGAKNPRGYYRCTHRFAQGCMATKQVQISDSDPSVLEISYMGRHTCNVAAEVVLQHKSGNADKVQGNDPENCKEKRQRTSQPDTFSDLDEYSDNKKAIFRTFSFSRIPNIEPEILSASPATSGSDYFALTWCGGVQTPQSDITNEIGSSGPTSVTNSPITIGDFDFKTLDDLVFDEFLLESYF